MTQPEIKAGQRYHHYLGVEPLIVKWADENHVLAANEKLKSIGVYETNNFICNYRLVSEPKTRPITADDIMKMLAVNPVIYERCMGFNEGLDSWGQLNAPVCWVDDNVDNLTSHQFSHNPFAPNPVIVGPEIEVTE